MLARRDLAGVGLTLDRQMLAKGPWLAPRPSRGILGVLLRACLGIVTLLCALIFGLWILISVCLTTYRRMVILEAVLNS